MKWEDFSEHLTHFTKADRENVSEFWGVSLDRSTAYDAFLSILSSRRVRAAKAFGIARHDAPSDRPQRAACFSEIPLHCLDRLVDARSRLGIGFTKKFATSKGALPIWYVEKGSTQYDAVHSIMKTAKSYSAHPIWDLTPFIDTPGTTHRKTEYRFEWEREWRVIGDFDFNESDVAFLILPEEDHDRACGFFHQARDENLGPFYGCPFIDGNWGLDRIESALNDNHPHNKTDS